MCEDPGAYEMAPTESGKRRYFAFGQIWDSISGYWLSKSPNEFCKKNRRQLGEYTWLRSGRTIPIDSKGRPYELHHIDGNKRNNLLSNLEYQSIEDHHRVLKNTSKVKIRQISTGKTFDSIRSAIDYLNEGHEGKIRKPGRYIVQSHLSGDYVNPDWERIDGK